MSTTDFIPEIWGAQLLTDFTEQATAANLVARDYEGEARKGNTVHIVTATSVPVKDYKAGVLSDGEKGTLPRTTAADPVANVGQELLIDQEKSFDFYVDDIDRAQSAGSMDAYTRSAAEGLVEDADTFLYKLIADAATPVGATKVTTGDAAFNVVRDLRKALNKAKVPAANRFLAINAEFEALLLDASSRITTVDTSGSPGGLREAILGRLLGFTLVNSENLPETAKQQALAWYRPAVAYVSQVEETEGLRAHDKFADRLRGLHVYGGKVIRPAACAKFTASAA
jgi:hypothetical protein